VSVSTDSDGRYSFRLPEGRYQVRAGASSDQESPWTEREIFLPAQLEVTVLDRKRRRGVDFELSLGASVIGYVLDPSGAPLASAVVTVAVETDVEPSVSTWPDETGRFVLNGLEPGWATVRAKGERSLGQREIRLVAGPNALDIRTDLVRDADPVEMSWLRDPRFAPVKEALLGRQSGSYWIGSPPDP